LTVWISGIKVLGGISAMIGVGAIFTLSWLARLIAGAETFTKVKEYRLLLVLSAVVLISALWHIDGPAGLSAVSTYLQLFLLFVLVIDLTTTPARLNAIVGIIIVSSTLLAALICLDQLGWLPAALTIRQTVGMGVGDPMLITRAAGLWGDANYTALQLTIALPFIMACWPAVSRTKQILLLAAGGAILAALVWTFSVGGLLGVFVMLLSKMMMVTRRDRLFVIARNSLIGLVVLLAFIAFAPDLSLQRVSLVFESTVSAIIAADRASLLTIGTNRGDTWWAALQAIAAAPLLGHGPGNGIYANASYTVLRFSNFASSHNMLLAVAGDLGLVGLVLFGALFGSALLAARTLPDAPASASGLDRTRQALFIALIGYAVQGMALEIHNLKLLWILLGTAIAVRQLSISDG